MAHNNINIDYINDFQRLHELSTLNTDEVAKALGVSRQTIHNWKTGRTNIPNMAMFMMNHLAVNNYPKRKQQTIVKDYTR